MKITFLGTGTSCGVPTLGCSCKVCRSTNPHDSRLRCAALVETDTTRLLIDCGPDIRQQLMPLPFRRIDGVLLTHMHYDRVGGIDALIVVLAPYPFMAIARPCVMCANACLTAFPMVSCKG